MADDIPRVLSVQSHVVSGYVGNKCVTFPLQVSQSVNGFEVDTINSVQFSNHTGYPQWKGQVLKSTELEDLYVGLKLNRLTKYSFVLTGYVADESFLSKLADEIHELHSENSNMYYICDPVMGDDGHFYVADSLLPVYRNIISLADVITPNQFEAEALACMKIKTEEDVISVLSALHRLGPKMVVITSTNLAHSEDVLYGYGGEMIGNL
ncbi:unnamed protein product [Soboliphyme baturini]|uniref:Pyridoxal kinase n=1 Tax=Soboliphyme baturini TaxID=241478 RepID=A0A183IPU1_9BILA|nr:unnamed protein product [Soboliphyme baturini]